VVAAARHFPGVSTRRRASLAFALTLVLECGRSTNAITSPATSSAAAPPAASPAFSARSAAIPVPATEPDGMLLVPAGPFTMGADRGGQEDEHPAHTVTLPAFFLDKTEVPNSAYERCVAAKACQPHDPKSSRLNRLGGDEAFRAPDQPISSISWEDAKTFCAWSGKRLPTEAEWEKAARGTDGRTYPWGNAPPTPELGVYATNRTAAVGSRPGGAGPFGHLDMAGNVWEWLEDIYDPYAYRREGADRGVPGTCEQVLAAQDALRKSGKQGFTGTNPIPTECERVLRGGAFNYGGPGLRSSNRVHHPAYFHLIMSGVRCAKSVEEGP
jgi:formylglycine-generating enzyme required for sulfatase activity